MRAVPFVRNPVLYTLPLTDEIEIDFVLVAEPRVTNPFSDGRGTIVFRFTRNGKDLPPVDTPGGRFESAYEPKLDEQPGVESLAVAAIHSGEFTGKHAEEIVWSIWWRRVVRTHFGLRWIHAYTPRNAMFWLSAMMHPDHVQPFLDDRLMAAYAFVRTEAERLNVGQSVHLPSLACWEHVVRMVFVDP